MFPSSRTGDAGPLRLNLAGSACRAGDRCRHCARRLRRGDARRLQQQRLRAADDGERVLRHAGRAAEILKAQLARFHEWHRREELPAYARHLPGCGRSGRARAHARGRDLGDRVGARALPPVVVAGRRGRRAGGGHVRRRKTSPRSSGSSPTSTRSSPRTISPATRRSAIRRARSGSRSASSTSSAT